MNKATTLHRLLLAPPGLRTSLLPRRSFLGISDSRPYATVQNVASASFWKSLIPKPLRKSSPSIGKSKNLARSKEWNPATFFIIIFMLVGSMSIQMIALKNEFASFTRRADAKIGLLKEIIERIKSGEEVDVEGLLGTGDAKREQEWEEVLREIEEEDQAWEHSRRSKTKHSLGENKVTGSEVTNISEAKVDSEKEKSNTPSGFY